MLIRCLCDKYGFDEVCLTQFGGSWAGLRRFAIKNYTKRYVVDGIVQDSDLLEVFWVPGFVHVSLDAALANKLAECNGDHVTYINEAQKHDTRELMCVSRKATVQLYIDDGPGTVERVNKATEKVLEGLFGWDGDAIGVRDMKNPLRPSWDIYFMKLAQLAASRSSCMKRKVGCVIVQDLHVIATGYNGTPRDLINCSDGGCPRCNNGDKSLSICFCLHAEENALLEVGRDRLGQNAVLYCNTCPCLTCSVKIIQIGIVEVVYSNSYRMDKDCTEIFAKAGVKLWQLCLPETTLVVCA